MHVPKFISECWERKHTTLEYGMVRIHVFYILATYFETPLHITSKALHAGRNARINLFFVASKTLKRSGSNVALFRLLSLKWIALPRMNMALKGEGLLKLIKF